LRLVLAGLGVVGRSLVELIAARREELVRYYGLALRIVAVGDRSGVVAGRHGLNPENVLDAKRRGRLKELGEAETRFSDMLEALDNVDADIFIDATPTNIKDGEPSYSMIRKATLRGMNIVTVNKGPLALAFPAIAELAERRGVMLRFSGTVGGGMPVLEFAKECARADEITQIEGILNGTTNYILTQMEDTGLSFAEALKQAQDKGYAERDPSLDVKGLDTACKLVILANAVLKLKTTLADVNITGIEEVTQEEVREAKREGKVIKLIGRASDELTVKPERIPANDTLNVKEAMNAVRFTTRYSGRHTITGRGAGGYETATAILRDVIAVKQRVISEV